MNEDKLRLIELATNIATAIGTMAAVWVALYLAHRERKIDLEIKASFQGIVTAGNAPHDQTEAIVITIINHSARAIPINSIGWRTGWIRKKYFFQVHDWNNPYSSRLPITLQDSEIATYVFDINKLQSANWAIFSPKGLLFPSLFVNSIRVSASSPLSKRTFYGSLNHSMKNFILLRIKKQKSG